MNLPLYTRIIFKHRGVLLLGFILAVFLAVASYYKIPSLQPRKAEVWQSQANVYITEPGFAAGSRAAYGNAGRFAALSSLYARLAESDQVERRILRRGTLEGSFQAAPLVDNDVGAPLPIVALFGKGTSPELATTTLARGLTALLGYVRERQVNAGIPERERIELSVINAPGTPILIEPRKKTLPIVVFLAVMIATIAFIFIIENSARNRALPTQLSEFESDLASQADGHPPLATPELKPQPAAAAAASRARELPTDAEPRSARSQEPQPASEPDEHELVRVRRWA